MQSFNADIIDIVEQKDGDYTVVVQVPEDVNVAPDENFQVNSPGTFTGMSTRVDRLWHLYFTGTPQVKKGDSIEIRIGHQNV